MHPLLYIIYSIILYIMKFLKQISSILLLHWIVYCLATL